jgi:hypothetical protein
MSGITIVPKSDYRASIVGGLYEAQVMCPVCKKWCLTNNLEVSIDRSDKDNPVPVATATLLCTNSPGGIPCGHEFGEIELAGWQIKSAVRQRMPSEEE